MVLNIADMSATIRVCIYIYYYILSAMELILAFLAGYSNIEHDLYRLIYIRYV